MRGKQSTCECSYGMELPGLTLKCRYFENCHLNAPFLSEKPRYLDHNFRFSSPLLFLAICCVGARFWETSDSRWVQFEVLHREFHGLII